MQACGTAPVDIDELVKEAQEGTAAAFAGLYEHFFDSVFRYVSFKTGSQTDAEDITSAVFLKMLVSIRSFKWKGHPFSSWLFRIAHNLIVDDFRQKGRRKAVPMNSAHDVGSSDIDMSHHLEVELAMGDVRTAMRDITDLQREVISLRFAAGLSVSETARAVRKKENAVKALQHAALKKLKRILNQEPGQPRRATVRVGDW